MAKVVSRRKSNKLARNKLSGSAHKASSRANERGANMVEYALLAAMVALIVFAALKQFGINLSTQFSTISSKVAAG